MIKVIDEIRELNKKGEIFKILGPCSCSSEEEIYKNASLLKDRFKFDFYRVGLWKPRTHPGQFEGLGRVGLQALSRIEKELGIRTCTEVGTLNQLEDFLMWGLSGVWIGGRTTQASMVIEEIAVRLAKEKKRPTLFIKNPISGSADALFGAVERFLSKGITDVVVVFRGVSIPVGESELRNVPGYSILAKFRAEYPEIPFLIDPSHIAGKSEKVLDIYHEFSSFLPNGVMVETHFDPSLSLTDKNQLLNFDQLEAFLSSSVAADTNKTELHKLRKELDDVDSMIISLLNERLKLVTKVGTYKKNNDLPIYDKSRQSMVVQRHDCAKSTKDYHGEFYCEIFKQIHDYSCQLQAKITTITC